ncbi:MAG: NAD(P)/FAD-dependent oxidoreductase [Bacillota bacterium]|nr:NAD(P)/FAD-dependent oxidoreductase [Bacillota bacterium]
MEQIDILIIGGGVVGLAVCEKLSLTHKDSTIILMERHDKFGEETSSRNSEVIHSGIYYPAESLKTKLCVRGNKMLYDFCSKWDIPHKRLGKLIIARNSEEVPVIEAFMQQGLKNDVTDLELLNAEQVQKLEPNISAAAAIFSPSTGIVDSHKFMARLESISVDNGAMPAYGHEVTAIAKTGDMYRVAYKTPEGTEDELECSWVINCAGLGSDKIAAMEGIDIDKAGYSLHPCKGDYFSITGSKSALVTRLVYPPPLKNLKGLGVHITKSLDGRIRLGPDAAYVDNINYDVNPDKLDEFYTAVKDYIPFINKDDLSPDMAGIRPKLQGPGDAFRDFIIHHEEDKGLKGIINLIGIESPGLTSSLSIAEMVAEMIA